MFHERRERKHPKKMKKKSNSAKLKKWVEMNRSVRLAVFFFSFVSSTLNQRSDLFALESISCWLCWFFQPLEDSLTSKPIQYFKMEQPIKRTVVTIEIELPIEQR
jgi:hypothetical protein